MQKLRSDVECPSQISKAGQKLQVILSVETFRHAYEDCLMYSVRRRLLVNKVQRIRVFCRFVLPCQILLPPIKTVGSTIRHRKPAMNKFFYLVDCVLLTTTPTPTLNLPLQQGSPTLLLESYHPADFSSNPPPTHLSEINK